MDAWCITRALRRLPGYKSEDSGESTGNAARVLRPDHFADRLSSVSLDDLAADGITGIIVDLDNTLVGYGRETLEDGDAAWIVAAKARDFKLCLVSNNFNGRVNRIGRELGLPAVPSALKPLPGGFLRALRLLGTPKAKTVVVGDQLFTDVLGARFAGLRCILTRPIAPADWLGTRVLRQLERLVLRRRRSEERRP